MVCAVTGGKRAVPEPAQATVRVLAEVVPRVAGCMGPAWCAGFIRHLAEWIGADRDMISAMRTSSVPTPQAYVCWRRVSGAVGWCFDLIEFAQDAELAEPVVLAGLSPAAGYRRGCHLLDQRSVLCA